MPMIPLRALTLALVAASLMLGCSRFMPRQDREYRDSSGVAQLEVPPELSEPQYGSQTNIPGAGGKAGAGQAGTAAGTRGADSGVLPQYSSVEVRRDGSHTWLEVQRPPEEIWPQLEEFWRQQGIDLKRANPETGVMETDWVEQHSSLPGFGLQGAINKVGGFFIGDVGIRDRFRLRMERQEGDNTAIYVSSQRAELQFDQMEYEDTPQWGLAKPDPEVDAEMLTRLMVFLGANEEQAHQEIAATPALKKVNLELTTLDGAPALVIDQDFSDAWRVTGISLDRAGLFVERQDRGKGIYYFTYTEQVGRKRSFWEKLAGDKSGLKVDNPYEVHLEDLGGKVVITAHNSKRDEEDEVTPEPLSEEAASRILERLRTAYQTSL